MAVVPLVFALLVVVAAAAAAAAAAVVVVVVEVVAADAVAAEEAFAGASLVLDAAPLPDPLRASSGALAPFLACRDADLGAASAGPLDEALAWRRGFLGSSSFLSEGASSISISASLSSA